MSPRSTLRLIFLWRWEFYQLKWVFREYSYCFDCCKAHQTPQTASHIHIICMQLFQHLDRLWIGIQVHPQANIPQEEVILLAKMGFWWVYLLLCLLAGLPNPLRLHLTSISYVFRVFKNLDMLWMGIWVHPYTVTPEQIGGWMLGIWGQTLA